MATSRLLLSPEAEGYRPALEMVLTGAIRDAEDRLARSRDIGSWMREEALLTAMQIGQEANIQAGADALSDLLAKTREQYRVLDEAIGSITNRHARLGVHLDPLNPDHSHPRISFRHGRYYDAFRALETLDGRSVTGMLDSLTALLPSTQPFPGHPHTLSALVVVADAWLKLTVVRTAGGNQSVESFEIEAPSFELLRLSSRKRVGEAILQYFGYADRAEDPQAE